VDAADRWQPGAPGPPPPAADPPTADAPDFSEFDKLTDVVVVLDERGDLVYANDFTASLTGHDLASLTGRSMAEFLHPDDLVRALEVIGLVREEELRVPVTPALYRLRCADGSWVPVEINAAPIEPSPPRADAGGTGGSGPLLLVIGRYSGDRHLQDRIVDLLTAGAPIPDIVELIPEFGLWRHPDEHYAVVYAVDGQPRVAGSPMAAQLASLDGGTTTPWARARATGEEVVVPVDDLPEALRAAARADRLLTCWAVPVPDPNSAEPAVLIAWSRDDGPAPSVHRYSLETMARSLTLVLQWRAQVAELEQAARRDPLTGVINRMGFFEILRHTAARRVADTEARVGILYVDLDHFKAVNDRQGHRAGDLVLAIVAERLTEAVRTGDVVARLGGDEFAVVCPDFHTRDELVGVAERIIARIAEPMTIEGTDVQVGASIGIAFSPVATAAATPDDLVDEADRALYLAKSQGRGRWHVSPASH
jgi:diguanylate cyclase (GGDEF)-like protein/PAS domain S-box-containing protein